MSMAGEDYWLHLIMHSVFYRTKNHDGMKSISILKWQLLMKEKKNLYLM